MVSLNVVLLISNLILTRICTPKMENVEEIRTPKMKPFLGKMMAQEQNLAPETPIAPNLKIELCILPGMNVGRSRSPVNPSMKISIVNCAIGETCTPSNSELFGNAFGYVHSYYHWVNCLTNV